MKDNNETQDFIVISPKIKITQCNNGFIVNKCFKSGEGKTEVVEGNIQTLAKRLCVDILCDLKDNFQLTGFLEFEYKVSTQINPF